MIAIATFSLWFFYKEFIDVLTVEGKERVEREGSR